jgi:bifunctional UDP-N-acetylglucosamine pyrophosphorylase/glucosamine-1-phosphate N-acetyltransferase
MREGVTMPDPGAVYVGAGVRVGRDTVLHPGTHLRGATVVGEGCEIGPDVVATDCTIGDGCTVLSAHMVGARLGDGAKAGPFAYLRPGSVLEPGSRVGTYVEIKNTVLGRGAKVPHLSYVGDARVGEGTNIGAGNITANYDGFRKHATTIGARVRTGSDCVFVAPVTVGDDAMTGAGSIITEDVPAGALGIARARQSVIEGFTEKAAARARAAAQDTTGGEHR